LRGAGGDQCQGAVEGQIGILKADLVAALSELHVLAGLAVTEAEMVRDPGELLDVTNPLPGPDQEHRPRPRALDRVVRGVDRGSVLGLDLAREIVDAPGTCRVLVRTSMRRRAGCSMDAPCIWYQPMGEQRTGQF
jgi:hypothetical protein